MADEENVAGPEPPSNPARNRHTDSPHHRPSPRDRKDSRSRSPLQRDRYGRIRSPDRRDRTQDKDRTRDQDRATDRRPKRRDNPPKGPKGFAWKDTRKRDDDTSASNNSSDDRFRRRDEREAGSRYDKFKRDDQRDNDSYRPSRPSSDRRSDNSAPPRRDAPASSSISSAPTKKISSAPSERMIVVHVNDRLGTKAKVPCFPSDPVKLFKAQVAAMIGRQPHEIMLKRQSERPFKDQLTLLDYGVSDGVQLDLELDTGD
ncbi:hypothetical protein LTS18_000095 [Coniosporium uncinatum]|uniref:Uncharacterized protein n=1 Tax=Coniosporium uncinatum TaxID=93489 RepID=A0ACC3DZK8_9PEZI|nr:hypothetical protein LTS18_000095 [Coniosporium uncinatum]